MWQELKELLGLPIAAACGAALAFRPVRRGTPPRDPAVIQTQIVLAIVGALIMIVVGASLARAFGIVGAASLVRYRAKISDPKDAAVMLVALAVGTRRRRGHLPPDHAGHRLHPRHSVDARVVRAGSAQAVQAEADRRRSHRSQAEVERLLREQNIAYELRQTGNEGLEYALQLPPRKKTDKVANAIAAIDPERKLTIELDAEKSRSEPNEAAGAAGGRRRTRARGDRGRGRAIDMYIFRLAHPKLERALADAVGAGSWSSAR